MVGVLEIEKIGPRTYPTQPRVAIYKTIKKERQGFKSSCI